MIRKSSINCVILFLVMILCLIVTIFLVKNPALSAVLATIIGSGLTFSISRICELIKRGTSHFSGYYRDEIFSLDNPDEIIKRDKFQLIHKDGNVLSGSFTRYLPETNILTNWKCAGFIVMDQYLLAYRAVKDTTPSRGVILVKSDTKRTNGLLPCYSGKYFKFEGEKIVGHNINLIQIDEEEYNRL